MGEENSPPSLARNVVVCCDGTGNHFTTNRTNVLRLWRSLVRDDRQLAFYDPGVGTLGDTKAMTRWRKSLWRRLDGAIGISVRDNVLDAYEFLVRHWRDGDRLFFFGFSRGAYTVRALTGMLDWFGLVRPEHVNVLPYLWNLYSNEDGEIADFSTRIKAAGGIRKTMGRSVRVHFLGAWDTVSSFGWIWQPKTLPETAKVGIADHVRHAVSIHERRRAFAPNLFTPELEQDCVQMLFPGVHADVGGGYPAKESGLAKGALKWMLDEAEEHGLRFDPATMKVELFGKDGKEGPDPKGQRHDESRKPGWRVIEILPRGTYGWLATPLLFALSIALPWFFGVRWWAVLIALLGLAGLRLAFSWRGRQRRFDRPLANGVPMPRLSLHPSAEAHGDLPDHLPPTPAPESAP